MDTLCDSLRYYFMYFVDIPYEDDRTLYNPQYKHGPRSAISPCCERELVTLYFTELCFTAVGD